MRKYTTQTKVDMDFYFYFFGWENVDIGACSCEGTNLGFLVNMGHKII